MKNILQRRKFLIDSAKATAAIGIGSSVVGNLVTSCASAKKIRQINLSKLWKPSLEQTLLPYAWDALEPIIDKETMNIHFTKHAAGYSKNLKEAVAAENASSTDIIDILKKISSYSIKMRNNAGGHYNHELFWQLMKPGGAKTPTGNFLTAIEKDFGSLDVFKAQFETAAKDRFGSGWSWLIMDEHGKLVVGSTPNQDNPLMNLSDLKGVPLLGLDVWEHAYYLKYQNRRAEYIANWWKILNWDIVQERFDALA